MLYSLLQINGGCVTVQLRTEERFCIKNNLVLHAQRENTDRRGAASESASEKQIFSEARERSVCGHRLRNSSGSSPAPAL